MKPCLVCGKPTQGSRCADHSLPDRDTRTTSEKGYGTRHQAIRREVLRASGADRRGVGGSCAICREAGTDSDPLQADHVLALSLGGASVRSNYQAAHQSCNVKKGGANRRSRTHNAQRTTQNQNQNQNPERRTQNAERAAARPPAAGDRASADSHGPSADS